MHLLINEVIAQEDYQLLLTFANGEKRIFDLKPYLNLGIFSELRDMEMFKTVRPCFDSVEWANEADIDPEILYQQSKKVG
jgi:Protein of unknown function (DUF2442).